MNNKTDKARDGDVLHYVWKVQGEFDELMMHLRNDIPKLKNPKAQALFETSAEVIDGLRKAFKDYEDMDEEAWK